MVRKKSIAHAPIAYEHTIKCNVCKCKTSEGALPAESSLSDMEIMKTAKHNPQCPVQVVCCPHKLNISSKVESCSDSHVTHYEVNLL